MKNPTVGELLKEHRDRLKLCLITGEKALERQIHTAEVNRPGLALAGHSAHFRAERIQIIGRGEHDFCLKSPPKALTASLAAMLSYSGIPCLVITRNLKTPEPLAQACRKYKVPLLRTSLDTATFVGELSALLEDRLAPVVRLHGVLVDVYGLGVLIQGEAGIGKSECALELVKRGHILVSDDIVEIRQKHGQVLIGGCPEPLKHYMEVRGLGIIDVKLLFGIGSILNCSQIGLVMQLEMWNPTLPYERSGLNRGTTKIIDVEIPLVRIPVSPGRNLAVLIEVAALNQRLKSQGYFSAETFNQNLIARMSAQRGRSAG
ncbi:MAG TPA: HPr(Ser) kinase/phosphatase [Elusimicrobia bacterium]|nr:HPr(Ser) kinase/phosphatase [Elusimicrobiota bacterium]